MLDIVTIPMGQDRHKEAARNFWSDVNWRTIHCIVGQNSALSISEIARATALTVEEAVAALEGMQTIGLVQRTEQGYKIVIDSVRRAYSNRSEREEKVRDFAVATHQVINRLLENPEDEKNYTRRVVYNSNLPLVQELISSINKAIDLFKEKSEKAIPDGVYALSAAMTPMTKRGIYE